jgi:hypothetical protein
MSVSIYVGEDQLLPSTSGLGFYGNDGFGESILIGEYNGRMFVTNASGTEEGFECNNNKYLNTSGVIYGQTGNGIQLISLPNSLATINVRFEYVTEVKTLAGRFYIFDGTLDVDDIPMTGNPPSGLTCYTAETRHQTETQIPDGIGDTDWLDTQGSTYLEVISSPGTSGLRPNGSNTLDTRHDWYIAMTATPFQFGNKQFAMYFETEFL